MKSGAPYHGLTLLLFLFLAALAVISCSTANRMQRSALTSVVAPEAVTAGAWPALAAPSSTRPVTCAVRVVPAQLRAGGTAELQIRLEIAAAHHIYATNTPGTPFTPLSLDLSLPAGFDFRGGWVGRPPERTRTGDLLYTDSVVFRRFLHIGSNAPPGPVSIQGEVRCQACTEELCWPPDTLALSTSITVLPRNR